jgi:hypothetical protein
VVAGCRDERVTPGQIARFFAQHAHPDRPTDFD